MFIVHGITQDSLLVGEMYNNKTQLKATRENVERRTQQIFNLHLVIQLPYGLETKI